MSNIKKLPKLAENIRTFRLKEGLSQAELGEKIGYSQQIINAYENGTRVPPSATLEILANHFRTSIDILVGKKKSKQIENIQPLSSIMKKFKVVESFPPQAQRKVLDYVELIAKSIEKK